MTETERAFGGYLYEAYADEFVPGRRKSAELNYAYNRLGPFQDKERWDLLKANMGSVGEGSVIMAPFFCDFWDRASLGKNFFANYNFILLCGNYVTFGDDVKIAPNVGIYGAGHPFDPEMRRKGLEYALPITVGNNVWIGGHSCVMSGVRIGDDTIIAAGSVVVRDIPAGVLAGGNPCRVIRTLTPEDDRRYLQRYHAETLPEGGRGLRGER